MECIVLAGGLGTRLREVVEDVPKCMAPVAGKPFLAHVLQYLETQFVDHVIFSLGYKYEMVMDWLRQKAFTFKTSWVIEQEPLGTGGGVKLALNKSKERMVFVLNGDTMFKVDFRQMQAAFKSTDKVLLALKPMHDFDRYGTVDMDVSRRITAFKEKQYSQSGLINGGVYLLDKHQEDFNDQPKRFSLEQDFFEREVGAGTLSGFVADKYFIDIGVPADYYKAQEDFQ